MLMAMALSETMPKQRNGLGKPLSRDMQKLNIIWVRYTLMAKELKRTIPNLQNGIGKQQSKDMQKQQKR